jgi:hypothetical protein
MVYGLGFRGSASTAQGGGIRAGLITYLNLHQLPKLPPREPHLLAASSRCSALSVLCKLCAGRYTCGNLTLP